MRGPSKTPTSRGRNLNDGLRREPNVFEKIKQAHARHGPEDRMSMASRAATTPDVSEAKKLSAVTATGNWMQRAAEATNQRLRRMFGRYLHLTPDGTAEISKIAPVAQEPLRVEIPMRGPVRAEPDIPTASVQRANGISVDHTPLHALAGGAQAMPRDNQPTKAVTDFLATGSRPSKSAVPAAHTLQESKKAPPAALRTKAMENPSRTQSDVQKEQEGDSGIGRGIEE